jgi:hypothetical protein
MKRSLRLEGATDLLHVKPEHEPKNMTERFRQLGGRTLRFQSNGHPNRWHSHGTQPDSFREGKR